MVGVCLLAVAARYGGDLPRKTVLIESETTSGDSFPRTITDDHGYVLTLPEQPQRIVSQTLVTDHFLMAVVPHERIVGVSQFGGEDKYSHKAVEIRQLNAIVATDPERVLKVRPDLTLTSNISRADFVELLRESGVPTFRMHTTVASFREVADGIRTIGRLTGEEEAAEDKVDRLNLHFGDYVTLEKGCEIIQKIVSMRW